MSTTTLSQRLRDLRNGLFPDIETVNAVLDRCIAQAEAMEGRAGDEHEKGRDPVSIALARNSSALTEWRGEQLKAIEPKTLTDDEIDRVTDDLGLGSRGRASFRAGLRYARDHYLKPSQPIGAQKPVAWMKRDTTSDMLPESALELVMERDAAAYIRKTWMPLYGSPISPEARDRLIEAGQRMKETFGLYPGSGRDQSVIEEWGQALSALRGEK